MTRGVIRAVAALVFAALLTTAGATSAQAATVQDDVHSAVNRERVAVGLPALRRDATLDAAAQEWARVMRNYNSMFHSSNDWRAQRIPAGWNSNGENIAYGYSGAAAVMNGWMNSPGHKANILRSGYTRMGVGYVAQGNYWVQIFAGYSNDLTSTLSAPTPTVSGTAKVGQTLSAQAGSWGPSPVATSYQWRVNGAAISGARSATFIPRAIDVGARITVTVSGSKSGFTSDERTSVPTGAVVTNRSVSRISGDDRFDVANAIAVKTHPDRAATVYVTNGLDYPDALSAAPAAIVQDAPLLLTRPTVLLDSVRAQIVRLAPQRIVIVGGPASVSPEVEATLQGLASTVVRISGQDRYEVSRSLANYAFPSGANGAYIPTGANFPDALSAGSAAGSAGDPVLLVNGNAGSADAATQQALRDLGAANVKIAGGTGSVTSGIAQSLSASGLGVERFAGANRYAASIAINADAYKRSGTAYLATGQTYPDALAGAVLAGRQSAPLFVVPATCVPRGVIAQIESIGATNIVLLGGPGSLSAAVQALVPCAS